MARTLEIWKGLGHTAQRSDRAELRVGWVTESGLMSSTVAIVNHNLIVTGEFELPDAYKPRWFAVHTRSRHEKSASELLRRKDIETFLPLYHSTRRWQNGDHEVHLPLFPGYTFVRMALRDRLDVLKVPGVVGLVGIRRTAVPLDDPEIEGLRLALAAGVNVAPHPYLIVGRRVRITAGPLNGHEGILVRRRGALRVVLSIDLIQRSVLVDLDASELEPAY